MWIVAQLLELAGRSTRRVQHDNRFRARLDTAVPVCMTLMGGRSGEHPGFRVQISDTLRAAVHVIAGQIALSAVQRFPNYRVNESGFIQLLMSALRDPGPRDNGRTLRRSRQNGHDTAQWTPS